MPPPRKSPPAAKRRVVRKTLADGTVKEYRYGPRSKPRKAPRGETVEALMRAFEASPEFAQRADKTREQYAIYLRPWSKVGHLRVRDIKRAHILALRDAVAKARGNGAGTAFARVAGAMFAWAVDREWLDTTPATRIKALPGGHHRPWTDAEAARAKQELPGHLARVVVLGEAIGQRRGDLAALTWAAYDGRCIRLRQQKTARARAEEPEMVIPLPADVRAELDRWKARATSTHILTNTRGQPWTAAHLSREMKRATEKLGMPGLTVHGLRRRTAVRVANAGGSVHEIKAVTGHRTLQMVALYTEGADQEALAGAAIHRLEPRTSKPAQTKRKGK